MLITSHLESHLPSMKLVFIAIPALQYSLVITLRKCNHQIRNYSSLSYCSSPHGNKLNNNFCSASNLLVKRAGMYISGLY